MRRRIDFKKHRLLMGVALALNALAILLIMGRSFFAYLGFIVKEFYQLTPFVTWVHGITGGLAEVFGIAFLFKHPRKIRRWMMVTAILWVIALTL